MHPVGSKPGRGRALKVFVSQRRFFAPYLRSKVVADHNASILASLFTVFPTTTLIPRPKAIDESKISLGIWHGDGAGRPSWYVSLYFPILEVVRSLIRVQSQGLCDKSTATHETDCTRFLTLNCHSVSYVVELVTLSAAVLKLTLP